LWRKVALSVPGLRPDPTTVSRVAARRGLAVLAVGIAVAGATGCGGRGASAAGGATGLHTLPGVEPPYLQITHAAQDVTAGFVFVAQKGGKDGQPDGPVIADNKGRIRWYHQLAYPVQATDFRVQTYHGRPVLTWWQGTIDKAGIGRGYDVIDDTSYHQIATVHAGDGLEADLHEFQLTPRGTAFITAYHEVPADLRSVGGPEHGWVYDSVVQEIDVGTGRVVFEWHSLGHVPFTDSFEANHEPAKDATKKRPLDYFHVNAVSDGPNGTILVSGRNTSTIYLLARDGRIIWRMGGKRSDFGPAAAVRFRYQHDARMLSPTELTVFDNGAIPKSEPYTRPLVLHVDVKTHTVRILKTFVRPQKLLSPYEGDLELLPDGGAFVGWGGIRRATEFTAQGKVNFELRLPFGDTYRAFRLPWTGTPSGRPLVSVAGADVYASWNGATKVVRWQVLGGPSPDALKPIASAPWNGLETRIAIRSRPRYVVVRALDSSGRVLATSAAVAG
jgi:Arylsulfotransferase (ASST)